MNWQQIIDTATVELTAFGLKVAGAIAVWIVGRYLIGLAVRLVSAALTRQHVDPTLLRYLGNIISVALNVVLVVAILGYFGVETTSFAALVAAMGIAIGAAWAGCSPISPPGAFLVVLRPFKVGDYVKRRRRRRHGQGDRPVRDHHHDAGQRLGLRRQQQDLLPTPSRTTRRAAYRRVDRRRSSRTRSTRRTRSSSSRRRSPRCRTSCRRRRPTSRSIDFNARGPLLAVRPYTHTDHYWQVYFDTNRAIAATFGAAGYPVPESHVHMMQMA